MTRSIHIGVFDEEARLLHAIEESRELGLDVVDAYSPYPIHGIDDVIGIRRSRLPIVCFLGGLTGLCIGLWFQYWSSATSWPLNVGGKPFDSLPAFIPVAFEMTVLCAGLLTAFMLLFRSKLWPGNRHVAIEGVTDDRFALVIARKNAERANSELPGLLQRNGAVKVWQEVEA